MLPDIMGYDIAPTDRKTAISLTLHPRVLAALTEVARAQDRSRSYVVNACLAQQLGVVAASLDERSSKGGAS